MNSSTDAPIDPETDFEKLSARLRTQSGDAPGSDTERVTIRSLEDVSTESLSTLLEAAEADGSTSGDVVFVLSRTNADRLVERASGIDDAEDLEDRLGRPVQVEADMPDDTVFLLDPGAIDGEEVVDPDAATCGIVGSDD